MNNDQIKGWPNRTPPPDSLPPQAGHAGELLTTDGTTASWAPLTEPAPVPLTALSFPEPAGFAAIREFAMAGDRVIVAGEFNDGTLSYFGVFSPDYAAAYYWTDVAGTSTDWDRPYIHLSDAGVITVAAHEDDTPNVITFMRVALLENHDGGYEWQPLQCWELAATDTNVIVNSLEALCGDPSGNVVALVRFNNTVNGDLTAVVVWIPASGIGDSYAVELLNTTTGSQVSGFAMELIDPNNATGNVQVLGEYWDGTDWVPFRSVVSSRGGAAVLDIGDLTAAVDNRVSMELLPNGRYYYRTHAALTAPGWDDTYWFYQYGAPEAAIQIRTTDYNAAGLDWAIFDPATMTMTVVLYTATDNAYFFDVDRFTGEVSNIYLLSTPGGLDGINGLASIKYGPDGVLRASHRWNDGSQRGFVALPRDGRTYTTSWSTPTAVTVNWAPAASLPPEITVTVPTGPLPQLDNFTLPPFVTFQSPSYSLTAVTPATFVADSYTPESTVWTVV